MTNDACRAIDQQLDADSAQSSEVEGNLYHLCDWIGPRFAGTDGFRRAAEYVLGRFEAYQLDHAHLEAFDFNAWRRGPSRLTMTQPFDDPIACYELPYGGSTGADGVTAGMIDVGDGTADSIKAKRSELPGKFALISRPGRHRMEIFADCVKVGAAGMILCNRAEGMVLCSGSVSDAEPGAIPAVSIGYEAGLKLQRLAAAHEVQLHLTTQSRCESDVTWNVIGEVTGSEHPEELVIVGGHLDSHEIGPGAYDNCAGAVMVTEMARLLAGQREHLKRTVRFIAFGAEEVGLLGSRHHAKAHVDALSKARLMFNCDMPALNAPWGLTLHRCPQAEHFVRRLADQMAMDLPCRHVKHAKSDHYPFTLLGIPAMALFGTGPAVGTMRFGHMAGDTPERIPVECLSDAAAFAARIIVRAANDEEWPARSE